VVLASWQVMLRSEDPNGVALQGVTIVLNGTGGDLSQYRVLSAYLAAGLQALLDTGAPPFQAMRFARMAVFSTFAYVYYGQLGLLSLTRLLGICLLGGLISLSMGVIGPSTFGLDRFNDAIFYLVAGLLVLVRALERFQSCGAHVVSFGLVALADTSQEMTPVERKLVSLATDGLHLMEHRETLFNFKQKFQPCWQSRYLVTNTTLALPKIALAVLRLRNYSGDGLARVLHGSDSRAE